MYYLSLLAYLLVANYLEISRINLDGTGVETVTGYYSNPYYTYPYAYALDFDYR